MTEVIMLANYGDVINIEKLVMNERGFAVSLSAYGMFVFYI